MSVQAFMPGMSGGAPTELRHGLAVRYWGKGAALVLLHGGMGSWTHWCRNIGALARKFTVIALDMPGYGNSANAMSSDEDGYIDCVAKVFAEIVDEANPAGLVGFSFGAVIAAAVSRRQPQRVARLSLLGPAVSVIRPGVRSSCKNCLREMRLRPKCARLLRSILGSGCCRLRRPPKTLSLMCNYATSRGRAMTTARSVPGTGSWPILLR